MGNFFIGLIGVAASFAIIKYRERVADMIGEASWMSKVGGVYNFVLLTAIALLIFSVAKMTGTTDVFLSPFLWIIPGGNTPQTPTF